MTKLPILSGKQVIKSLSRMGFQPIRQRGSHVFMQHPDGRTTLVPIQQQIGRVLLKRILNEIDVDTEEFVRHL